MERNKEINHLLKALKVHLKASSGDVKEAAAAFFAPPVRKKKRKKRASKRG